MNERKVTDERGNLQWNNPIGIDKPFDAFDIMTMLTYLNDSGFKARGTLDYSVMKNGIIDTQASIHIRSDSSGQWSDENYNKTFEMLRYRLGLGHSSCEVTITPPFGALVLSISNLTLFGPRRDD